ncbi:MULTISPECIES: hypothetical protein [unclassified Paenibacillus]|uniref:hypothetical protein n=1 Tax=unclassified Paenibacillus TaxID=185978 RepID=UPI0009A84430|nr:MULTISPECIES: hypothetical protein [unclassified Paenibacillus]SLK12849.1 hypothetical protein SAMN06272722_1082 [Paenibacillus sp. RU5A]SOC72731.1 hypothetical protein SAMN05880581_1082 [Paenibacillus sp. RU26A]SOC75010.1 hypothetical protein SAMN05880586_1082 [Paenibacillus sp. RU5M]
MKKTILACMMIMLMLASACGNVEKTSNPNTSSEPKPETPEAIIQKNISDYCTVDRISLDSETGKYFYGTWKVEKLLGFANSYNDASEYPTGQKFIGDKIIIEEDFFSSKGLKKYKKYQYELKNPLYQITATCYNSDSFYRYYKIDIPDLHINDEIKAIDISDSSTKMSIPVSLSFLAVNNDRLILLSEATIFELKKIID